MGISMVTDMNEPINWLEVVMDYGKRFPTATYKELFGLYNVVNDTKLKDMFIWLNDVNHYTFLVTKHGNKYNYYFSTTNFDGTGNLEFMSVLWEPVPQQILLRLLTDGKEDLI